MTITKYRPQAAFVSPFNDLVNDLFDRDLSQFFGQDDLKHSVPRVNIVEREKDFELSMLAPGYAKSDIKLVVEDETMTISAEQKKEDVKETERFTRREFAQSAFSRSFKLPGTVDQNGIKARFENGILHVNIPKVEEPRPKTKEIGIE